MSTNINETTDSCLIVGIFWNRIWCCPLHWSQNVPLYPKLQSHTKELILLMQLPWLQGELEHSSISIQKREEKIRFLNLFLHKKHIWWIVTIKLHLTLLNSRTRFIFSLPNALFYKSKYILFYIFYTKWFLIVSLPSSQFLPE